MSGGGSKKPAYQPLSSQIEEPNLVVKKMKYPAFYPGHKEALAEQMTAGYGAPVEENMGLLNQLFQATRLPYVDTAATAAKAKAKAKAKSKPSGPVYHMGYGKSPYSDPNFAKAMADYEAVHGPLSRGNPGSALHSG